MANRPGVNLDPVTSQVFVKMKSFFFSLLLLKLISGCFNKYKMAGKWQNKQVAKTFSTNAAREQEVPELKPPAVVWIAPKIASLR